MSRSVIKLLQQRQPFLLIIINNNNLVGSAMKRAASSEEVIVENSDAPLDLTVKTRDSQQQSEQPLLKQGIHFCRECQIEFQNNDSFMKHKQNDCPYRTEQQQSTVVLSTDRAAVAASSVGQEQSSSGEHSGVWRCNFCNATSSSYYTIWRHQLRHVKQKRYLCQLCGVRCKNINDMWLHAGFHNIVGLVYIKKFIHTQVTDLPLPKQDEGTEGIGIEN